MTTNLIAHTFNQLHRKSFALAPTICPHCGEDVNAKILRVTGDTVRDVFTATLEERAGESLYLVERAEPIKVVVVKATPPSRPREGEPAG